VNTPKNYLILFLALTTLGCGALAWRQYQELVALRASALNNDERADLQRRLWAAEKRKHELEASLAAKRDPGTGEPADAPDGGPGGDRRAGNRNNMAGNFMAMMDKPEIQKLMAIQQRSALDARFAALFKNLNLSPAQLEQFKNLLVEKQTALTDALAAARAQGINPRADPEDFQKLIASAQAEADNNIKVALGDAGYAQYQQYQQTLPQRNVVTQLAQSLSYTSTPLTADQTEQMVSILAANTPASNNSPGNTIRATVVAGFGIGGPGQTSPITNDAITQSQTILSPAQVTALQQLQATQQAQAQLQAAMRNQFRNSGPAGGPTTTTTSPTPTKSGPGGG
jgi:hypothetical protein